jgi:hypothetical protein
MESVTGEQPQRDRSGRQVANVEIRLSALEPRCQRAPCRASIGGRESPSLSRRANMA